MCFYLGGPQMVKMVNFDHFHFHFHFHLNFRGTHLRYLCVPHDLSDCGFERFSTSLFDSATFLLISWSFLQVLFFGRDHFHVFRWKLKLVSLDHFHSHFHHFHFDLWTTKIKTPFWQRVVLHRTTRTTSFSTRCCLNLFHNPVTSKTPLGRSATASHIAWHSVISRMAYVGVSPDLVSLKTELNVLRNGRLHHHWSNPTTSHPSPTTVWHRSICTLS